MSLAADLKVLYHLALSPIRGGSHQERLESFYRGQAGAYDAFRTHLLRGREELYQMLPAPEGGVWLDLGGGTGANLEHAADRLPRLGKVYLVDLSASLLQVARRRIADRGWTNVEPVEADVTTFRPAEGAADLVTFSYSLTMIPNWWAALEHAWSLLRPGGTLGVVDFYVAHKYPGPGCRRHAWVTRTFWPAWLALDNVFVNPDHVPFLHARFERQHFSEHLTRMRYFPLLRVPYYLFIGRKAVPAG